MKRRRGTLSKPLRRGCEDRPVVDSFFLPIRGNMLVFGPGLLSTTGKASHPSKDMVIESLSLLKE